MSSSTHQPYSSALYDGTTAEDFYYILDSRGKRMFYSRRTGKRTAISRIPQTIISDIKQRPAESLKTEALLKQKEELKIKAAKIEDQMRELPIKLAAIHDEINSINCQMVQLGAHSELREEQNRQRDARARYEKEKKNQEDYLRGIFNENKTTNSDRVREDEFIRQLEEKRRLLEEQKARDRANQSREEDKAKASQDGDALLKTHGIASRRDLRAWLLQNHPDKNPQANLDLVQSIITLAEERFPKEA